jgi:hypothetical protein
VREGEEDKRGRQDRASRKRAADSWSFPIFRHEGKPLLGILSQLQLQGATNLK